jgi:four helix bundle protein
MQRPKTKTTNQKEKSEFQVRVYKYTLSALRFIGKINTNDQTTRVIISQLIRSLTSIGANIIEAKASSSKKDFAHYFDIALKSANETKYWLYLLRDLDKADREMTQEIIEETIEIANILGSSLLTMRNKRNV